MSETTNNNNETKTKTMTILTNQFKSPTTKKYNAALDDLSSLKCGTAEYTAKQQEIETLLETIEGEAKSQAAENFGETLDRWHLLSRSEKNTALRSMTDGQRQVIRFNEQLAESEWNEQQQELRELGY